MVLLVLQIRNKVGFIYGTIPRPAFSDSFSSTWNCRNSLIVAWILRSVSQSIASTVLYPDPTKLIWEKLHHRFSTPDDTRKCHLQRMLFTIIQGTRSVDSYFPELNCVLEELRNLCPFPYSKCGKCNDSFF